VFTTAPALVLLLTLLRVVRELGGVNRHVVEAALLAVVFTAVRTWRRCCLGRACAKTATACWRRCAWSVKVTSSRRR
jgi:hypothetical protein